MSNDAPFENPLGAADPAGPTKPPENDMQTGESLNALENLQLKAAASTKKTAKSLVRNPIAASPSASSAHSHAAPARGTAGTPTALSAKRKGRKTARTIVSHVPVGKRLHPIFRFTKFFSIGSNVDTTRNVVSRFLIHTSQEILRHCLHPVDYGLDPVEPERVVVLHPGSKHLRAGLVTDTVPRVMPNVIARRVAPTKLAGQVKHQKIKYREDPEEEQLLAHEARTSMEEHFKTKMKEAALRTPINSVQLVQSFNSSSRKVSVAALNDPLHVDWHHIQDLEQAPPYFIGQKALDLDDEARKSYELYYPIYAKSANTRDYASPEEWAHDMLAIWTYMLFEELGIGREPDEAGGNRKAEKSASDTTPDVPARTLSQAEHLMRTRVVLIVPDLMDSRTVEDMMNILLRDMGVHSVLVGQESLSSCVGAGLSTACIVDVGAQATTLSIVENGELVDATRLLVGGDDITQILYELMCENKFPLAQHIGPVLEPGASIPPRYLALMEEIKEKWCTCNEQELAIQVVDVFIREPGQLTIKYQTKVYNEVYMAPLALIYPAYILTTEKLKSQ